MSIEFLSGGLLTTVQDLGREGWQKYGVVAGGALDQVSLRIANLLIGNTEDEAAFELTLKGPTLRFTKDTLVAICGADLSPTIDDQMVPLWRPVLIKAESVLRFGQCCAGCRAYLACAGGLELPLVMGSRSTYLRAQLGGFEGRALKAGDVVEGGIPSERAQLLSARLRVSASGRKFSATDWSVSPMILQEALHNARLRVIVGEDFSRFELKSLSAFWGEAFLVTNDSDRMGYRLRGSAIKLKESVELISETTANGAIQVLPDGQMIILLADRQTIGGYPKIAYLAGIDLPVVAQLKPGETIRFQQIGLVEAQALLSQRERQIESIKCAVSLHD